MKIKVLPESVINKISAGEVIERPAAVVRELVDNSLDAGATEVSIYLGNGGHALIRVVDNGSGMNRDDAILAFERHATSKLRSDQDLLSIQTLGFRGEALSSIGAVSKVRLKTREKEGALGVEVEVKAGKLNSVRDTAVPCGTDLQVEGLFFNTPARRKFLRSPATEEKKVKQWVIHSSIAHPHVHYRLYIDQREVLVLAPRETSILRGREFFRGNTVSIGGTIGNITVRGVLAHPALAQVDTDSLVIIVNARPVSDRMILKAVKEGFFSTLKERELPLGFVSIELPSSDVDVNVHPQKSEVRFRNPQEVFLAVRQAVQNAVKEFSPAMVMQTNAPRTFESGASNPQSTVKAQGSYGVGSIFSARLLNPVVNQSLAVQPVEVDSESVQESAIFRFSALRYIGQALGCYLFCECEGAVYVIDMHAAHERYNFNLIRNGFRERGIARQKLLVPERLALTESAAESLVEHLATLEQFGFEIEETGIDELVIQEVPAILVGKDVQALMKDIAALPFGATAQGCLEQAIDNISARIACHASVRTGDRLSKEEAYALFAALDKAEFSAACPHGRPIMVKFTASNIEKWFGRDR